MVYQWFINGYQWLSMVVDDDDDDNDDDDDDDDDVTRS